MSEAEYVPEYGPKGRWCQLRSERDRLAEIVRVVVYANETEEGAIGLVRDRLDKDHADLLKAVLRESGTHE